MKRYGNLYQKICSIDNLMLAHKRARKGKTKKPEIISYGKNLEANIQKLHSILEADSYSTSEYYVFKIYEPKEREIFRLPYHDRVVHHAIMNVIEPIITSTFICSTYNCIKKRGIHKALRAVRKALKDPEETKYCLKLDIKKFYPSVDHDILKALLRRKFKDQRLLNLLDGIIDSSEGLPIGNYLSQPLANFYLTYFDHWVKEELKIKHYFRYCDDMVILGSDKRILRNHFNNIKKYLKKELNLELKSNYQIFPVEKRGIDFVGYRSFHNYTLLRKSIKKRFIKMVKHRLNTKSVASYNGWLCHANCINLRRKYLTNLKI